MHLVHSARHPIAANAGVRAHLFVVFYEEPTLRKRFGPNTKSIAGALIKGEFRVPLLLEDEDGVAHGNDWAHGFMRGMHMRHDGWADLVNDDKHGGCLIPMMMLCHEHDEEPQMRPGPITPE